MASERRAFAAFTAAGWLLMSPSADRFFEARVATPAAAAAALEAARDVGALVDMEAGKQAQEHGATGKITANSEVKLLQRQTTSGIQTWQDRSPPCVASLQSWTPALSE